MQGDAATALGIPPPHTVRITLNGTVTDWPNEMIRVLPGRIECCLPGDGHPIVHYPYGRFHRLMLSGPERIEFYPDDAHHSSFLVECGPIPGRHTNGSRPTPTQENPNDRPGSAAGPAAAG